MLATVMNPPFDMKSTMKSIKLHLILGILLVAVGSAVLITIIRNQRSSEVIPGTVTTTQAVQAPASSIQGYPSLLQIPSLNLNLAVIPGIYNPKNKTWTLSLDKVQYAVMTPQPNNIGGNTFIYGHYRSAVFATLHTIKPGAQAIVKTTNGHTFTYKLSSVKVTAPSDISPFNYTGTPILTLQTCTGILFQNRQLFTFNLVTVA